MCPFYISQIMVVETNFWAPNNENVLTESNGIKIPQCCIFSQAILFYKHSDYAERMISELKAIIMFLITLIFNLMFCFLFLYKVNYDESLFPQPHSVLTTNIWEQRFKILRNSLFFKRKDLKPEITSSFSEYYLSSEQ